MIRFLLNNNIDVSTHLPVGTLVLDFVRYHKNFTGTKIGCREGDCGACTVLVGEIINGELTYSSATSCLMAIGNAHGKHIVTVEGLNMDGLNAIQEAMSEEGATQCGFCTPGFVVSLAGFCLSDQEPTYSNAIAAIDGNICRCTGYKSIERAAQKIAKLKAENDAVTFIDFVTEQKVVPAYFKDVKARLLSLSAELNGRLADPKNGKKILGGGTDLYVQQHDKMTDADLQFVLDDGALNGIAREGERCILGASTTVSDLAHSPIFQQHFPGLARFIKLVSSTPIRNMATVAGNIINASPIGDLTIFFMALDAVVVFSDGKNKREVELKKLYRDYKILDKNESEFFEKIWFQLPPKTSRFNFEKISKRTHLDIASVNTAGYFLMDEDKITSANLSAGGVGPVPMFLANASACMAGKKITEELIDEVIEKAQLEISPISDARGSEAYKRLLLSQLLRAHFVKLFETDMVSR